MSIKRPIFLFLASFVENFLFGARTFLKSVDKNSVSINETSDIKSDIISKIKYFFEHYKDLDPDKWIKVKDFIDVTTSKELIKQGKKNITEKLYFTQAFK